MTPIVHEVLKRASELLATEENWTQGRFARDRNNHPVDYTAENACKFCLRGAIKRAAFFCGDINHMA